MIPRIFSTGFKTILDKSNVWHYIQRVMIYYEEEENECWDCHGTGIGNPHFQTPCPTCGGSGILSNDDNDDGFEPPEPDYDWCLEG